MGQRGRAAGLQQGGAAYPGSRATKVAVMDLETQAAAKGCGSIMGGKPTLGGWQAAGWQQYRGVCSIPSTGQRSEVQQQQLGGGMQSWQQGTAAVGQEWG